MKLSNEQIVKLIKEPKNEQFIQQAILQETLLKAYATGENWQVIATSLAQNLVPERRSKFLKNFGVHTMPILDKVRTHFERVFEANGRNIDSIFYDYNHKKDFLDYVSKCYLADGEKLNGQSNEYFFRNKGIKSILFEPNTIVYIDFPKISKDEKGEYIVKKVLDRRSKPVVSVIKANQLIDIEVSNNRIEYIIAFAEIEREKKRIKQYFVIDDERYCLFEQSTNQPVFVSEEKHFFGEVPASFFTDKTLHLSNQVIRKSPITESLPDLEAWIFFKNLAKLYQWESGVPIKFVPKRTCKNKHPFTPDNQVSNQVIGLDRLDASKLSLNTTWIECQSGFFNLPNGGKIACPDCARQSQEKNAWGKEIELPESFFTKNGESNKAADMIRKAFGYEEFSTESLQFNENDLERKREQIEFDIIGKGFTSGRTKEARNVVDVQSDTEDLKRVLTSISEQIETVWTRMENLIIKARVYSSFVSRTVFLGREYLLQSVETLLTQYAELVKAGADSIILNRKLQEIAQTQYGYDSIYLQFVEILSAITPFRHIPIDTLIKEKDKFLDNTITKFHYYLRLYEPQLINEFLYLNSNGLWGIEMTAERRLKKLRAWLINKTLQIVNQDISYLGLKEGDLKEIEIEDDSKDDDDLEEKIQKN